MESYLPKADVKKAVNYAKKLKYGDGENVGNEEAGAETSDGATVNGASATIDDIDDEIANINLAL